MKKIISLLLLLLVFGYVVPAQAVSVSPLSYQLTLDPGVSQTLYVTVQNNENKSLTFKSDVIGVGQDNAGWPIFGVVDEAAQWVRAEPAVFDLKPRESKTIGFTIFAPPGAEPGAHYFAFSVGPRERAESNIGLSARAAVLVSLAVSGVVQEAVSIEKWEPDKFYAFNSRWPFQLTLKNNGTVPSALLGSYTVWDWNNNKLLSQDLPMGNRLIVRSWRRFSPVINFDNQIFWPGPYQVQFDVTYGLSRTVTSALATVWFFPLWSIFAALALLLFFIIIGLFLKLRR